MITTSPKKWKKLMEADSDLDKDDAECELRDKIEDEVDKKWGDR